METKQKIHSFTDLEAWKKAHALVVNIYLHTKKYPKDEQFGITNQMRRAAVSITSNIAEGFSRISPKEKAQFYAIAQGSLTELQNQLLISRDVGYVTPLEHREIESQVITVHKLINGLSKYVRTLFAFLFTLIPHTFYLILFLFPLILFTLYLIPATVHAALSDGLVGYWTFFDSIEYRV